MTATVVRMREPDALSGEAMERAKRRRRWLVLGLLALVGIAIGFAAGKLDEGDAPQAQWPAWAAIAIAAAYVALLVGAQTLGNRGADELERHLNMRGMFVGGFAMMLVYPVWYALWRGGLAIEPDHQLLFLIFVASLALGTLYHRFR